MTTPHDGGPSAPFGPQHLDDKLPRPPSNNLPGTGDESAIADYIAGKQTGDGFPVGGSDPNMNRMTRHGVRRDVEPLRNFCVAESRLDQLFDFLLPLGEAHVAERGRTAAHGAGAPGESIGGLACENIAHARDGPVAATLRTAPTLDTANGPRHAHPLPVPGAMYVAPRTSGIHRGDELIHDESLF